MKQSPWLQLYFVCASLLGLILLVFGTVSLVDLAITSTVVKVSPEVYKPYPTEPYISAEAIERNTALSEEEKANLERWAKDYQAYQETEGKRDYEEESRRRTLSRGIAVLVAGLPIFFFHAPVLFRKMNQA